MQRATSNILSFATIASISVGLACGGGGGSSGSGSSSSGSNPSSGAGTSGTSAGAGSGTGATGSTSGATATGASSGTGGSACGAGASTTTVSFANDLMPIIQANCSVGGLGANALCHADPSVNGSSEPGGSRQYFGPPSPPVTATTTPSLTAVYKGFVGVASTEDKYIDIVTPSQPDLTKSFLWYKLNGTQNSLDAETPDQCVQGDLGNCGSQMPLPLMGSTVVPLPQKDLDLFCNWIEQGAKNN
jgi:hypothetical protein